MINFCVYSITLSTISSPHPTTHTAQSCRNHFVTSQVRSLNNVAVSKTEPFPLAMNSVVKCVQLCTVNKLHPYATITFRDVGTKGKVGVSSPTLKKIRCQRFSLQKSGRGLSTIIMASRPIDDVPRRCRVVCDFLRDTIRNRGFSLVEMLVTMQHEVDAVFEEQRLEGCLALFALESS